MQKSNHIRSSKWAEKEKEERKQKEMKCHIVSLIPRHISEIMSLSNLKIYKLLLDLYMQLNLIYL